MRFVKLAIIAVAAIYGITCALDPGDFGFMDNVDLVFHEAGHVIFSVFGSDFITVLGGTVMQILIPGIAAWALYASGQRYSAGVVGVWLSQSLFNVSVYAADAWEMKLPLLGGEGAGHDWNYIIVELNLVGKEQDIAFGIYALGVLVLAASVSAGALYAWKTGEDRPERR